MLPLCLKRWPFNGFPGEVAQSIHCTGQLVSGDLNLGLANSRRSEFGKCGTAATSHREEYTSRLSCKTYKMYLIVQHRSALPSRP